MADKYLKNSNGSLAEVEGTTISAGASDGGKIPALGPNGKLDDSMMPTGIGADTVQVESSENLSAGDFVNIYNDAGTAKCRKADATTAGKEAHGFVLDSVTAPDPAVVYFEGTNDQLSGLTPGVQFLDTTAGLPTSTPPATSGNIVQKIGIATSATTLNVECNNPITLA